MCDSKVLHIRHTLHCVISLCYTIDTISLCDLNVLHIRHTLHCVIRLCDTIDKTCGVISERTIIWIKLVQEEYRQRKKIEIFMQFFLLMRFFFNNRLMFYLKSAKILNETFHYWFYDGSLKIFYERFWDILFMRVPQNHDFERWVGGCPPPSSC